jgi:hypothetical protein
VDGHLGFLDNSLDFDHEITKAISAGKFVLKLSVVRCQLAKSKIQCSLLGFDYIHEG